MWIWIILNLQLGKYGTLRVERAERLLAASALTSLRKKMRLERWNPCFSAVISVISVISHISLSFTLRLAFKHMERSKATSRQQAIEGRVTSVVRNLAKFQPQRRFLLRFVFLFLAFILGEFHILLVPFSVEPCNASCLAGNEVSCLDAATGGELGVRQRQKIPNKILERRWFLREHKKLITIVQLKAFGRLNLVLLQVSNGPNGGNLGPGCSLASGWSSTSIATGAEAAAATAPWRWSLLVESCETNTLNSCNWNWQCFCCMPDVPGLKHYRDGLHARLLEAQVAAAVPGGGSMTFKKPFADTYQSINSPNT